MSNKNYFEIFGLEVKFEIDLDYLEEQYLKLQKIYHPDSAKTVQEAEMAIEINTGYRILKDEYLRACYMLELNEAKSSDSEELKIGSGMPRSSGSRVKEARDDIFGEQSSGVLDNEFLLEILEKMEHLENKTDLEELAEIKKLDENERALLLRQIAVSFEKGDLQEAKVNTAKLKYYYNFIQSIEQKLEKCF